MQAVLLVNHKLHKLFSSCVSQLQLKGLVWREIWHLRLFCRSSPCFCLAPEVLLLDLKVKFTHIPTFGTNAQMACLLVGCLTSQQHASVSQGRIYLDTFTCCHTETEVAVSTFHLTQSQYTDTGPTSPSTDPITPGAWQGSTGMPIFKSLV